MKILFVAMSNSIHTARWISQIPGTFKAYLMPSIDEGATHPNIKNITVYHTIYSKPLFSEKNYKNKGLNVFNYFIARVLRLLYAKIVQDYQLKKLNKIIRKLKPDIIHSMETQAAGYLVAAVKKNYNGSFPVWIHTNWGSDIYLFGRLAAHKDKIKEVLSLSDFYSCECDRDVELAKKYGFQGTVLPVFPNTGGFNLEKLKHIRFASKPSKRNKIMLKGYQGWAGRSLVGIRALERCSDLLSGYEVLIYSAQSEDVHIAAELLSLSVGIPVRIIPKNTPHDEILGLHAQSRISIGLSISDAISTSVLEAMVMGSFPIQSWTAAADEWFDDGKTGLLVPPEDPEIIEKTIRQALTDDLLVDTAFEENWKTVVSRLDEELIKSKIENFYDIVIKSKNKEKKS